MKLPTDYREVTTNELLARGDESPILISEEYAAALAQLRRLLRRYCDRQYELDDPAASR